MLGKQLGVCEGPRWPATRLNAKPLGGVYMSMTVIRIAAVLLAIDEIISAALNFTVPSQAVALTLVVVGVMGAPSILGSLYLIPSLRRSALRRTVLILYALVFPIKTLGLVRWLMGTPNLGEGGVSALALSWLGAVLMLVSVVGTPATATRPNVPAAQQGDEADVE